MESMFQVNDVVLYGLTEVCVLADIREESFARASRKARYYVLKPLYEADGSLIFVPVEGCGGRVRRMVSADELKALLASPSAGVAWPPNPVVRRRTFEDIIRRGDPRETISLIRTLRERQREKETRGEKLGESDEKYLATASGSLYPLLKYVLNIRRDEVGPLVSGELGGERPRVAARP